MAGRCPPGVICIENITLFGSIVVIGIVLTVAIQSSSSSKDASRFNLLHRAVSQPNIDASAHAASIEHVRDHSNKQMVDRHHHSVTDPQQHVNYTKGLPVNIPTQAGNYLGTPTQLGILTGNGEILPLMGKQLITSRDTWNYYTISNQRTQVRLPISYKKKSCTSEYGCDGLSTGDVVYVEGYGEAFKVTMYQTNTMRYIPYV
mgnify:CR=1 FL=1|tara:strand:+ start:45 stop:653 length:609 start_codon:yes stop_codon:yes gene_type:complete